MEFRTRRSRQVMLSAILAGAILGLCACPGLSQSSGRQSGRSGSCQNGSGSQSSSSTTTSTASGAIAGTTSNASALGTAGTGSGVYSPFQISTASLLQANQLRAQLLSRGSGLVSRSSLRGANVSQSNNQASGAVTAQITDSNELVLAWSGNPRDVQRVYFATLNANGQILQQAVVTQLPVQTRLALTNSASQYGVRVQYANGTARTIYSPIR